MLTRALPILLLLVLGGCSASGLLPDWSSADMAGEEPPSRFIIANHLKEIVGDPTKAGTFQISSTRRVDSLKGASWVTCLKVQDFPRLPVYYAVFIQKGSVVDSRVSVIIDQCELQSFQPYDWIKDGNNTDAR